MIGPRLTTPAPRWAALIVGALALAACGADTPDDTVTSEAAAPDSAAPGTASSESQAENTTITLVAYESFPSADTAINDQLAAFTAETGIAVEILIAGDTGTMLSKAELTAGNPEGDVMWGIDNSFISRAIESEIFEPYTAAGLDQIPASFTELVPNGEATPVDFGDICVNYDIAALESLGIDPPTSLADLADPTYADLLVVQDPASSSPGLGFLLGTVDEFGVDGWQQYWSDLVDNGVLVVDGWTQAYYDQFSYSGGDRPLVVSYGSSPPVEVIFGEGIDTAPTGVVEATCYRQIEFAGVLAGTEHPTEAQALIDFMITTDFQTELPLTVFVFPANQNAELAQTFVDYAVIPDTSRSVDPALIDENREAWIDEWTDLVIG